MSIDRPSRIAELVQGELAMVLRTEIKDPRVSAVTITHVRVSPDLKHARVHVVSLGGAGDLAETLAGLEQAKGWIRRRIGQRLRLRYTPKLQFVEDEGLEKAVEMTELLDRLAQERQEEPTE
jgi:ribosome-binding factor A